MPECITVKINDMDHTGEIVVTPAWHDLDTKEQQDSWDQAVRLAQKSTYYLLDALYPAADPRHCMGIDQDGTEHHYLSHAPDLDPLTEQ